MCTLIGLFVRILFASCTLHFNGRPFDVERRACVSFAALSTTHTHTNNRLTLKRKQLLTHDSSIMPKTIYYYRSTCTEWHAIHTACTLHTIVLCNWSKLIALKQYSSYCQCIKEPVQSIGSDYLFMDGRKTTAHFTYVYSSEIVSDIKQMHRNWFSRPEHRGFVCWCIAPAQQSPSDSLLSCIYLHRVDSRQARHTHTTHELHADLFNQSIDKLFIEQNWLIYSRCGWSFSLPSTHSTCLYLSGLFTARINANCYTIRKRKHMCTHGILP